MSNESLAALSSAANREISKIEIGATFVPPEEAQ